ncbi:fluoride efflux transporter CrcB [Oceanibacterium hippocampi]|uniref:Fluoride-specific ion channel FluC n=1 Tax=Oceanibacterium hippocampi TaxID=745714 RepID=A0A1Y5SLC6_9PROT|nr:fluoride efflux transporter CrcB [Oceanibacterium hippocampi]SLN40499.1 Putative fluoride ion transporter CrcB [Oceanibacterium hippocampi]
MKMLLFVALGGALGASARYLLAGQILRLAGPAFPLGTLVVNIAGSFVMGVLVEAMALRWSPSPELRLFLTVGLLGAFTTFSTFSLDVAVMIERGDHLPAAGYILLSLIGCVGGLFAALWLMRQVLS